MIALCAEEHESELLDLTSMPYSDKSDACMQRKETQRLARSRHAGFYRWGCLSTGCSGPKTPCSLPAPVKTVISRFPVLV